MFLFPKKSKKDRPPRWGPRRVINRYKTGKRSADRGTKATLALTRPVCNKVVCKRFTPPRTPNCA